MFKELFRKGAHQYITPQYWDGVIIKPIIKKYKVSLCTTCMDRLNDLSTTLPKNVKDNSNYNNTEFVILDYNSRKDNIWKWLWENFQREIEENIVVYYRTEEPRQYSMSNSRNIAFKAASGDIVNNVDADNFTNYGFSDYINILANQVPEKAIFAKGRRMLHGRLGFYREEFINLLGGYDETTISGYGHDDHDLLYRAWGLGFKLTWFGGKYYTTVKNHKKHQTTNFIEKDWKYTESRNKLVTMYNLYLKRFKANRKIEWGKATLLRNNKDIIYV